MIDSKIWEELERLDELATLSPDNLEKHRKHESEYGLDNDEQYQEFTDILTKYPAVPIGKGVITDIQGYIAQSGAKVKFVQIRNDVYALAAYKGRVEGQTAITNYPKKLNNILKDADPYAFYRQSEKGDDYRYRSDLDGRFEGLKFFDNHPEYHRNTSEERIREIRRKLQKREKLGVLNTDKE